MSPMKDLSKIFRDRVAILKACFHGHVFVVNT